MVGYYDQNVAAFQSGCSMVSSCKDYYNMNGGVKSKSKKSTASKEVKCCKVCKKTKCVCDKKKCCNVCKKTKCVCMKRGGGLIPRVSPAPVTAVQKVITKSIDSFIKGMNNFENKYKQSLVSINNMKIGEQRLVGGAKKKSDKKVKKEKKVESKPKKEKKPKKRVSKVKKGGSGASDFASTLASRGSAIAPDDFWEVPGEDWFRQFNKTAEYIPNSQLAYAAAPELTSRVEPPYVKGFDPLGTDYGSF